MTLFQKDKLFLGALAGIISDIIMNICEFGLQKAGLLLYTLDEFAGSMLIRDKNALMTFSGWLVGYLAGAALCILFGIIFVYLIELSGFRGVMMKGLLYGFVLWFLIYGGVKSGLQISYLQDYNPQHTLLQIILHLIFGLSVGLIVARFGRPAIIEN